MAILTIHATNVTGLGACQVVVSLLEAIESLENDYTRIDCHVPESGPVAEYVPKTDKLRMLPFRRRGPKALSRMIECIIPALFFELGEHLIVLGDVPLRTSRKQVVLVHQPHLQYPRVNHRVARTATFRIMRALTKFNAPYAACVIVQTEAMASGLRRSYPNWSDRDCIKVLGQPPPSWFVPSESVASLRQDSHGLRLFYPAAMYPHKNHRILEGLIPLNLSGIIDRLVVTVSSESFKAEPKWLSCVGRLNHADCLLQYQQADALVFPSVLESYGLPLVEAMAIGMPILAADLPYSRVLCGEEAIYFDPESPSNLVEACKELKRRMLDGWRPDWSSSLNNMPRTWETVAQGFLDQLE